MDTPSSNFRIENFKAGIKNKTQARVSENDQDKRARRAKKLVRFRAPLPAAGCDGGGAAAKAVQFSWPDIVGILNNASLGETMVVGALDKLVQFTGECTLREIMLLIDAGILNAVNSHFMAAYHTKQHPFFCPSLQRRLWELVANIAMAGESSAMAVLAGVDEDHSFLMHDLQSHGLHETPFLLLRVLTTILRALITVIPTAKLPDSFVKRSLRCFWGDCIQALSRGGRLLVMTDADTDLFQTMVLSTLELMRYRCTSVFPDPLLKRWLEESLNQQLLRSLVPAFGSFLPVSAQALAMRLICRMAELPSFTLAFFRFPNSSPQLLEVAIESRSAEIRTAAFRMFGNLATMPESPYALQFFLSPLAAGIMRAMRGDAGAIYAVMSIVHTCMRSRSPEAKDTVYRLLFGECMLQALSGALSAISSSLANQKLAVDIISVVRALRGWNAELTMKALQDTDFYRQLQMAVASQDTRVYEAALRAQNELYG